MDVQMEELLNVSEQLIDQVPLDFSRSLYDHIPWTQRLIGIKGARGTGKTTLLLQYLRKAELNKNEKLYVSLDDIYFSENNIVDFGKTFFHQGGKVLVLDEVHKYENWAKEIKNLYDRYPALQIIFTGSSIVEISKQEGDLSRRVVMYELQGLSYREFLEYNYELQLPQLTLDTLLNTGFNYNEYFPESFRPLKFLAEYLQYGYYPFFKEGKNEYYLRLRQLVRNIVEFDMAEIEGLDIRQAKKIIQLLYIIAQQVPFKPNISSLASKTNIHRNSMSNYLYYLNEARLIGLLGSKNFSVASLQKPEKIFLDNTNLMFSLSEQYPNLRSLRETFIYNQLNYLFDISASIQGDFLVNNQYTFEVGGLSKTSKQIKNVDNSWIIKDELEKPAGKSIPLWLFGFLY